MARQKLPTVEDVRGILKGHVRQRESVMDIPEDIRKTARSAEERYGDGTLSLSDAFALAVMTERERCAKIAEQDAAFTAAAAIRRG